MSPGDWDYFFNEYVYGFMFTDIRREIELGRARHGGGNFLAALGLLCYTEVLGSQKTGKKRAKQNFDAFFATMGADYASLLNSRLDVYNIFRCGMAHEYFVKHSCTIAMLSTTEACAVGQLRGGGYYFVVERYFLDFSSAARRLHSELNQSGRKSPSHFPTPDSSKPHTSVSGISPGYKHTLEADTEPLRE